MENISGRTKTFYCLRHFTYYNEDTLKNIEAYLLKAIRFISPKRKFHDSFYFCSQKLIVDICIVTNNTSSIIDQFKSSVQQLYGDRLSRIILFGSYARKAETDESDIDFLVVLKDKNISIFSEIEKINNHVYGLILQTGKIISFIPTTEEKFEKTSNHFYHQIKKDGIVI